MSEENYDVSVPCTHPELKKLADPTDVVLSKFQYLNLFVIVLWICEKLLEMCKQSKNEKFLFQNLSHNLIKSEFHVQTNDLFSYQPVLMLKTFIGSQFEVCRHEIS
jgi:hypothetical protein